MMTSQTFGFPLRVEKLSKRRPVRSNTRQLKNIGRPSTVFVTQRKAYVLPVTLKSASSVPVSSS